MRSTGLAHAQCTAETLPHQIHPWEAAAVEPHPSHRQMGKIHRNSSVCPWFSPNVGNSSGLEKYAAWFSRKVCQCKKNFQSRKVEKLKSGRVSFSISKSRKVEKLKSANASYCFSKSRQVPSFIFRSIEYVKSYVLSLGKPGSYFPSFMFGSIE